MSLPYLASMNQIQLAASIATSISDAPSSPSANRPSGGGTLNQRLTVAAISVGRSSVGDAKLHNAGSQAPGGIWRRDRNAFQVTASSPFTLLRCFTLLARI